MANKRMFKKAAGAVCNAVCEEIMVNYYNTPDIDKSLVEKSIAKVIAATDEAVCNANIYFGKGAKAFESAEAYSKAKKAYFKELFAKIQKDLSAKLEEAIKDFNAAIPAEVKAQNKAAANA